MVNSNVLWLEQWKVYVYGCNGWNTKVYAMYYLTMDTLSQQDKHILTPADSLHMYGKQGLDDYEVTTWQVGQRQAQHQLTGTSFIYQIYKLVKKVAKVNLTSQRESFNNLLITAFLLHDPLNNSYFLYKQHFLLVATLASNLSLVKVLVVSFYSI
jgi:hypothetical protein